MFPLHPHDPPLVGPYRLLARLGEDADTRSYWATGPNRSPVRVRIARPERATDPVFRAAFARRVEGSLAPFGPYVTDVVDFDPTSPVPWIATEHPPGTDLATFVREHGPLPVSALHTLAVTTARGLASLHSIGHAHTELRPQNVLLDETRALLSSPAASSLDGSNDTYTALAPPEGQGSPAGDVFSWAAVLCFAASGTTGPRGSEGVPLHLRGIVDSCLQTSTRMRPSATDLVEMLGGTASPALWPTEFGSLITWRADEMRRLLPEPTAPRSTDRRKRLLGIAGAALTLTLVAGTGIAWGYLRFNDGDESLGSEEPETGTEGLITNADCSEESAFPSPSGPIEDLDAMQVEFSPDGRLLAIGSFNHGLTLWDWREGEEFARPIEELNGIGSMEFAPIGCMVAATSLRDDADQEQDYPVTTTYDLPSGEAVDHLGVQPPPGPDGTLSRRSLWDFSFSADGAYLAIGNRPDFREENREAVGVIDMRTGEMSTTLALTSAYSLEFLDESRLAVATGGEISLWDVETGEEVQKIRNVTDNRMAVVEGEDQIVLIRDGRIVWLNLEDGSTIASFPMDDYSKADETEQGAWINDLSVDGERGLVHFSWSTRSDEPDPENLGTDRENQTYGQLWEVESGENLLDGNETLMPRPVAFLPEVIAAVNQDGGVDLIDPETLEVTDVIG